MELQNSTVLGPAANGAARPSSVDRFAIEQTPRTPPTAQEICQVGQPTGGRTEVGA